MKQNILLGKKHFPQLNESVLRAKTFLSKQNQPNCYEKSEIECLKIEFSFFSATNAKKRMF